MRPHFRTLLNTVTVIAGITGTAILAIAFLPSEPLSPEQKEVFSTLRWLFSISVVAIVLAMTYIARGLR